MSHQTESNAPVSNKRRRPWLLTFIGIGFLVVGYFAITAIRMIGYPPELEIGPETTVVTEPINAAGLVDYAAAINQQQSHGVTPDNNAAVPLLTAFGPQVFEDVATRGKIYDELGIRLSTDDQGPYFQDLATFLQEQQVAQERRDVILNEQFDQVLSNPWTAEEFPEIAAWLKRNEPQRQLFLKAVRKEKFYIPLIMGPNALMTRNQSPLIVHLRTAARLLSISAMQHCDAGDFAAAIEEGFALQRLSRLVGQQPFLLDRLVAYAINTMGIEVIAAVLSADTLTMAEVSIIEQQLADLPPLPQLWTAIDTGERYGTLDILCKISRGRGGIVLPGGLTTSLDPNVMLREANQVYDDMVAVLKMDYSKERQDALDEAGIKVRTTGISAASFYLDVATGNRRKLSKNIARTSLNMLVPAVLESAESSDAVQMRIDLLPVVIALTKHRLANGNYPETLSELVPDYLEKSPTDLFTGKDLIYQKRGTTFLLYSVGPNQLDDGGIQDQFKDDIAIGTHPDGA